MPTNDQLNNLLLQLSTALDIPDDLYDDAILKYEDIGTWLASYDSGLNIYSPEVYPQGSFRLGTVIRPISNNDEYDIDIVCTLKNIHKEETTQDRLKQGVGDALKKRDDLVKILSSSRRCWTLDYPHQFHMDILPSILNNERPPTGILLTDTELKNWQKSNPKAFSEWFYNQMRVAFQETRVLLAKSIGADVEDVPEWQVKTPLQRVIQLLKRHRDIYFMTDGDNKPASIIVTTLAARAYRNQVNVYEALTEIVGEIESNWGKADFVEKRNGHWWVANPVDPDENFADKWNENPDRINAFIKWLRKINTDLNNVGQKKTLREAFDALTPSFDKQTIARVANNLGFNDVVNLPVITSRKIQVPALGDTSHCQAPVWNITQRYKVSVKGSIYLNKGSSKKLWVLTDRPLPKNVHIRFSIKTDTPPPYEVKWQVVNTGTEALHDNGLRGEFYPSESGSNGVRWEHTQYAGTHWIEAFIIKNGICVARSGKKYVRIK